MQKKAFEEAASQNAGDQQAAARISSIESKIQTARDLADLYEYRIKNDIPLNREDWRSVTLDSIADNLMIANDPPMSEEDFTMQYSWRIAEGFTYQDYLDQFRSQQLEALDRIQIYKHSLEVGKPEYQQAVNATRRNALDAPSMLVLTTLFCVMVASGIVSSEHSKGTVRLLLMRPVKRWKILLSKYAMVLSLGLGMALLSTLLYLAGNIAFGAAIWQTCIRLSTARLWNPSSCLCCRTFRSRSFRLYCHLARVRSLHDFQKYGASSFSASSPALPPPRFC
ncbi:MAG: ABC transporter permease [Oscillospiraceae bacterium]